MRKLQGIFPALVTPYTSKDTVNESALSELVERLIAAGVDGFYVGGSTGEAFLLSTEERKRVLEVVKEAVGDRATVICHVGSPSTRTAVELARHAEAQGADFVSAVPPFYYKYSIEEIVQYYLDIAEAAHLPVILYNIPSLSGVRLDSENARVLLENDRIVGVKHTSMDLYELERMKRLAPTVSLLNGHDEVFLAGLAMGADGAVGSTYNVMPARFLQIRSLFENGRLAEASEAQRRANDIISVLRAVGVFQGIKHLLRLTGIDCGECRRPFRALDASEKGRLETIVEKL